MFRMYFMIFLLAHVVGDYYLQTEKIAKNKGKRPECMLVHGILYGIPFALAGVLTSPGVFGAGMLLAAVHLAIDVVKEYYFVRHWKHLGRNIVFIGDQAVHVICLISAATVLNAAETKLTIRPILTELFRIWAVSPTVLICWITALLIVLKPVNILVKEMLSDYKPVGVAGDKNHTLFDKEKKTGAMVGNLERIIMISLMAVHQYAAIGLVLTAKSVARYNQIAEDKEFAEYYLLGTLLSTVCVIVVYLTVLNI